MSEIVSVKHWSPPSRIAVKKNSAFSYRWIRKADVESRLDEGWVLAKKNDQNNPECSSIDQAAHYRSMILMKMPIHMVNERNAHYMDRHNRRLRATAVGAGMDKAAKDVNAQAGGELITSGIGETVMKKGSWDDKGYHHVNTETFDPKDVDPADLQEMADLKMKQKEDARGNPADEEVRLEESGGKPPPKSRGKSRK